ncbi:hypothetical protein ACOSQ3_031330 [Xanthoceras sorbifolium]
MKNHLKQSLRQRRQRKLMSTMKPLLKLQFRLNPGPRSRGAESLPKAILKRKKSTNYWLWAGPAALAVVLILALVYYYYLL